MEKHVSVLLKETIDGLKIKENGIYVDMTLGYGGHSKEIIKRVKKGFLFAFDKDIEACNYSNKLLKEIGDNFKIFNSSNTLVRSKLLEENIEKVDGIIFDLGVSSPELDDASRGFSYMHDASLDMRMDQNAELTAYDVVNNYPEDKLYFIFRDYGEEKYAKRIAKNIEFTRKIKPIETTFELVDIISKSIPFKDKMKGHPAKRVFQAIRIEVNNELEEVEIALEEALKLLDIEGIICVISFHSLEDRICKNVFKKYTEVHSVVKGMPNVDPSLLPDYELITKKPIVPSKEEITLNSRSKSAKLRIIKRIK